MHRWPSNMPFGPKPTRKNDVTKKTPMDSTSDERVTNNTLRHQYRVLDDDEKAQMSAIKDAGLALLGEISRLGNSRETSIARTKVEEAVMWACKDITS